MMRLTQGEEGILVRLSRIVRPLAMTLMLVPQMFLAGCGANASHDTEQVSANARRAYEQQQQVKSAAKLSSKEKQAEQQRLRMKYGDAAQ